MKYYFIPPWIDIYSSSEDDLFIKSAKGGTIKISNLYREKAESLISKLKQGMNEEEIKLESEEDIFHHLLQYGIIQMANTKEEINKLEYLDKEEISLLSLYGYEVGSRILSKISKSKILVFPINHFSNLLSESLSRIHFKIDVIGYSDNYKYNEDPKKLINYIKVNDAIEIKKFVSEHCKDYNLIICATDKPDDDLHLYSTNISVKNAIPNISCWVEKSRVFAGPFWIGIGTSCFNCGMLRRASSAEDFEEFVSYNSYINHENKDSYCAESNLRIMSESVVINIETFMGTVMPPDLMNNLLNIDMSPTLKITYERILRVEDCEVCGNDRTIY